MEKNKVLLAAVVGLVGGAALFADDCGTEQFSMPMFSGDNLVRVDVGSFDDEGHFVDRGQRSNDAEYNPSPVGVVLPLDKSLIDLSTADVTSAIANCVEKNGFECIESWNGDSICVNGEGGDSAVVDIKYVPEYQFPTASFLEPLYGVDTASYSVFNNNGALHCVDMHYEINPNDTELCWS